MQSDVCFQSSDTDNGIYQMASNLGRSAQNKAQFSPLDIYAVVAFLENAA